MKNVRSSQPCGSMNFVLNSVNHKFLVNMSIVNQFKTQRLLPQKNTEKNHD